VTKTNPYVAPADTPKKLAVEFVLLPDTVAIAGFPETRKSCRLRRFRQSSHCTGLDYTTCTYSRSGCHKAPSKASIADDPPALRMTAAAARRASTQLKAR
jgi:hypothetical protein